MNGIVFEITQEADGGFCAECPTESIFTRGNTWDELRANVREAVEAFHFDRPSRAAFGFIWCPTKCSLLDENPP